METVAGSSMHGEVNAHAVARRTGIPYTGIPCIGWQLGVPFDTIRTKSICIMNGYLAI